MLFKKTSKKTTSPHPFPGEPEVIDGFTAVHQIESLAGEFIDVDSPGLFAGGYTMTGGRAAAMVDERNPAKVSGMINEVAYKRVPLVLHLMTAPDSSTLLNQLPGIYQAIDNSGFFLLFAKDVQEAVDFTLIAHRIAELSLIPGICLQENQYTAHSLQTIQMPEKGLVQQYLGNPGDLIESPTLAQTILFGEKRRRIPELINLDRPAGIGGAYGPESRFKAETAQKPFFYDHLAAIADQAMQEFGELTGRFHNRVDAHEVEDGDYVIIARGAIVNVLQGLVQFLRSRKKIKLGVLDVNMPRPFPGGEISHLLKGKKGVTVLEQSDTALSEESLLLREIRSSVDRALENSAAAKGSPLPYPNYAVYERLSDRPAFFSGIYGNRQPAFEELLAVVDNMAASNSTTKKHYYIGVQFRNPDQRFPKLETLQQKIGKGYPQLSQLSLVAGNGKTSQASADGYAMQLHSLTGQVLRETGALLGKTIAGADYQQINTFSQQTAAGFNRPEIYSILFSKSGKPLTQLLSRTVDALLISNPEFLTDISQLKENGVLIVQSAYSPQVLWESFSEPLRTRVREKHIRLYAIDAVRISRQLASIPGYVNQISLMVLIGAFLAHGGVFSDDEREKIKGSYRHSLIERWGEGYFLVDEISNALQRGGDEAKAVKWEELPQFVGLKPLEPEAPWTVREVKKVDGTLFDLARFWDSVGYFYETGQTPQTLTDPFIAADVLPARSSAFRDMTLYRPQVPRLLPENCTGCGLCWTHCPDTALPPVVLDLGTIVKSAIERCKAEGQAMIQMQRIAEQLSKQAYRIFAADGLHQYLNMGDLLSEAYSRLIEMMGAKGDQLNALNAEFEFIKQVVRDFPIVKTATFFDEPHAEKKGSGAVLSITINPMSCKGCAECTVVCPEGALEVVPQTDDIISSYRRNWHFARNLPDISDDLFRQFVSKDKPATSLNQLLRKKVYQSLPGGDVAFPGSGVKTAVHLLTASVEALMQPRVNAFLKKIEELISQTEDKIQGRLKSAVHINDFEEFGKKLSQVAESDLNAQDFANLLVDGKLESQLNREQLQRLNGLLLRLKELRQLYKEGAHGDGRARLTLILNGGSISVWSATYPYNPHPYPWVNKPGADIAAFAEGIFAGTMKKMAGAFKVVRLTELELSDSYTPADHDPFFEKFGWQDFSEAEKELCPPLLILSDTEALGNISLDGISRILSGAVPIKIAVINTTSGLSHEGAGEDVDPEIGLLALSHPRSFVLQTSPGSPMHFIRGVMEGVAMDNPALFHIYASEPHLHGLLTHQAAEQEMLAVNSRRFPLFKYNPQLTGAFADRFLLEGNPQVESDWARQEKVVKDRYGTADVWSLPVTFADWAVNEGRFRAEFTRVPRGRWHDQMVPLSDYIALDAKERPGREPFIYLLDAASQPLRAVVSQRMVAATEKTLKRWQLLKELKRIRQLLPEERGEEWQKAVQDEVSKQKQAIETEYSAKLAELDQEHFQVYHQRLTQKLLAYFRSGQDVESLGKSLKEFVANNHEGGSENVRG